MFWFKSKAYKEVRQTDIDQQIWQVNIFYENRDNSRVSIGKKGINMRIANFLSDEKKEAQIKQFMLWAKNQIKGKEIKKFEANYFDGQKLVLYDQNITVQIQENATEKRASGGLKNGIVEIFLPQNILADEKQKLCSALMVKILRNAYQRKFEEKLNGFNQQFEFGKINKVSLKNNSSNWGSCSSKNNINLSLRLLLAPEEVLDYVIIHELAHLQQQNHSAKFWALVKNACPNYKKHEVWLKENSHLCLL